MRQYIRPSSLSLSPLHCTSQLRQEDELRMTSFLFRVYVQVSCRWEEVYRSSEDRRRVFGWGGRGGRSLKMGDFNDAFMRNRDPNVQARTKAQNRATVLQLKLVSENILCQPHLLQHRGISRSGVWSARSTSDLSLSCFRIWLIHSSKSLIFALELRILWLDG